MKAACTAAAWEASWKMVWKSRGLEAVSVSAVERPWHLGHWTSTTGVSRFASGVKSIAGFRGGASCEETCTPRHAGAPRNLAAEVRMRKRNCHQLQHHQTSGAATCEVDTCLPEGLSADAIVACLHLLAAQGRAGCDCVVIEDLTGCSTPIGSTVSAEGAMETADTPSRTTPGVKGFTNERASQSRVGRAANKTRGAALEKKVRTATIKQECHDTPEMGDEQKLLAAHVLLQWYVKRQDELSGSSILKLLAAMLTLRVHALDVLTDLADTIRRRLLRVLPADGLAAIIGTYCFFFLTGRQSAREAHIPSGASGLQRIPASVRELLSDAFAELEMRGGHHQNLTAGSQTGYSGVPPVQTNSVNPVFLPRRIEELRPPSASKLNNAEERTAGSSAEANVDDVAATASVTSTVKRTFAEAAQDGSLRTDGAHRLSQAGAVSCAWALSRLTLSRISVLSQEQKHSFPRELSFAISHCIDTLQSVSTRSRTAWEEEMTRLHEWGATAAALLNMRGNYRAWLAVTAENEILKALKRLRLILSRRRRDSTPGGTSGAPAEVACVHKLFPASSVHAGDTAVKGLKVNSYAGLETLAQCDLSKSAAARVQSKCPASEEAPEEHSVQVCEDDAATICGAVTSVLRLLVKTQHNTAAILKALQLLHYEDQFTLSLPKADLCYFLAAAQEEALDDTRNVDERTLRACAKHGATLHSPHGLPARRTSETKQYCDLPPSLYLALLLLPRLPAAGEGILEILPPRVLVLLLSMLSRLPGGLALHEKTRKPSASELPVEEQAADANETGHTARPLPRDAGSNRTRSGDHQQSSSRAGALDVHVVDFEEKLKGFTCDICRIVLERITRFDKRDIIAAISVVERLDTDARQLPFSGKCWEQHPDFSRVLDSLLRVLRRKQQKAAKRRQTQARQTSEGDDSADATYETKECKEPQQLSSRASVSSGNVGPSPTWRHSDPSTAVTPRSPDLSERDGGKPATLSTVGDPGEDARMSRLVSRVLQFSVPSADGNATR